MSYDEDEQSAIEDGAEGEGHALFPVPEGRPDRQADVSWIVVTRKEAGGVSTAPEMFRAEDLPDQAAVYARFGGGTYEFFGRDASRRKVTRRATLVLAGASRPLVPDAPPPPVAAPPPAAPGAVGGGGNEWIAAAITGGIGLLTAVLKGNTDALIAIAGGRSSDPTVEIIKQQNETMREMMRANSGQAGGTSEKQAYIDGQTAGMEMLAIASEGKNEPDAYDDLAKVAGTITNMISAAESGKSA